VSPGARPRRIPPRRARWWLVPCAVVVASALSGGCSCDPPPKLSEKPLLVVDRTSVELAATPADPVPAPESVVLTEKRGYDLPQDPAVAVAYTAPASGWLRFQLVKGTGRVYTLVLSTATAVLLPPPGAYEATVSIDSHGAEGVPIVVKVRFTVSDW
jgi:hypothetical protein